MATDGTVKKLNDDEKAVMVTQMIESHAPLREDSEEREAIFRAIHEISDWGTKQRMFALLHRNVVKSA